MGTQNLNKNKFISLQNDAQKKLWHKHQSNEYTKIHERRIEGLCYGCFKRDYVSATIVDICKHCMDKRGLEPILNIVVKKMYGYCFFCGKYNFEIYQINARFCQKCMALIRSRNKMLRTHGTHNVDPYWKYLRRVFGQDYRILSGFASSSRK